MKEMGEKLFKFLDMRSSIKFNDDNNKLKIDKFQKNSNYPFFIHT